MSDRKGIEYAADSLRLADEIIRGFRSMIIAGAHEEAMADDRALVTREDVYRAAVEIFGPAVINEIVDDSEFG